MTITMRNLSCDLCGAALYDGSREVSAGVMHGDAKHRGWRKDKAGRDVCPEHAKLKGAKR